MTTLLFDLKFDQLLQQFDEAVTTELQRNFLSPNTPPLFALAAEIDAYMAAARPVLRDDEVPWFERTKAELQHLLDNLRSIESNAKILKQLNII